MRREGEKKEEVRERGKLGGVDEERMYISNSFICCEKELRIKIYNLITKKIMMQ